MEPAHATLGRIINELDTLVKIIGLMVPSLSRSSTRDSAEVQRQFKVNSTKPAPYSSGFERLASHAMWIHEG